MAIQLFFAWFCLIYALVLFITGFLKNSFMIKMVKVKFGKKVTDERAVQIMYLFGVLLLIASLVLFIL